MKTKYTHSSDKFIVRTMDTLTCHFKSYNLKVYYDSYVAPIELKLIS